MCVCESCGKSSTGDRETHTYIQTHYSVGYRFEPLEKAGVTS